MAPTWAGGKRRRPASDLCWRARPARPLLRYRATHLCTERTGTFAALAASARAAPSWICARRASNPRNAASRSASANVVRLSVGGWSTGHLVTVRVPRENAGRPLYQIGGTICFSVKVPLTYSERMEVVRIGYARCSTDRQDLTAQRCALVDLGVDPERIYTDHGFTGRTRARHGLDQALAAVRAGDTLVVTKLDRLARSVPDAVRSPINSWLARSNWPWVQPLTTRTTRWARCSSTSSPPSPNSRAT